MSNKSVRMLGSHEVWPDIKALFGIEDEVIGCTIEIRANSLVRITTEYHPTIDKYKQEGGENKLEITQDAKAL